MFRHRGVLPIPVLALAMGVPVRLSGRSWTWGLVLVASGELLRLAGVAIAGAATRRRTRAVARLVTDGPFAWTRNPIYLGNGLIWAGVAAVSGVPWLIPVAVGVFAIEYGLIVRYEEGVLESTFGFHYLAYKRTTPRWLPRRPAAGPRLASRRFDWPGALRAEANTLSHCAAAISAIAVRGMMR